MFQNLPWSVLGGWHDILWHWQGVLIRMTWRPQKENKQVLWAPQNVPGQGWRVAVALQKTWGKMTPGEGGLREGHPLTCPIKTPPEPDSWNSVHLKKCTTWLIRAPNIHWKDSLASGIIPESLKLTRRPTPEMEEPNQRNNNKICQKFHSGDN